MKSCVRCKASKPHDDFHRHASAKDGRQSYCKECSKAYVREWEAANSERLAAQRAKALAEPVDPMKVKHCRSCDQDKPLLEFHAHRSTRDRRATYCKACAREYDRTIRSEYRREYMKEWRKRNPARYRANMRAFRLSLYGLTPEQFDEMAAAQDHRCPICGGAGEETVDNRPLLVVDHDHETNQVRALLCSPCNVVLSMAHDDPKRLRAAADYLEHHAPPFASAARIAFASSFSRSRSRE